MGDSLGEAIDGFSHALALFRKGVSSNRVLHDALFAHTREWTDLLTHKLVPQLAGEGCLVVAVAGGTNTGKSTVFNMLLGRETSPVRSTAAATCRPVLAGNASRVSQALQGGLFPELHALLLEDLGSVVSRASDPAALFVTEHAALPDRIVLLDTPDVDSIDQANWALADQIRAAGDVIIAVLTAEKYKDERVIAFYREARAAGRVVLPLMNKANPADDFATARSQIDDFCHETGLEATPRFVVPHDFEPGKHYSEPLRDLDGGPPLWAYLESLDVATIKARVFRDSVCHFARQAGDFLERAEQSASMLRSVIVDFETRTDVVAATYDPEPGASVGKLLHEHIKARRGLISRNMGRLTGAVTKALSPLRGTLGRALGRDDSSEASRQARTDREVSDGHERAVATGARNLARGYCDSAHALQAPADELVGTAINNLDVDFAVRAVIEATVATEGISEAFRAHVGRTLDEWWRDHGLKRRVLMELDAVLVLTPTAIAVPLSFYSGGVGVPEVTAVAGIVGGGFFEQILLHQLSDRWLKLIGPWRDEQQSRYGKALRIHLAEPSLAGVRAALKPFEDGPFETMRKNREQCLKAL